MQSPRAPSDGFFLNCQPTPFSQSPSAEFESSAASTIRRDNPKAFGVSALRGGHDVATCMMPIAERKTRAGKQLTSTNATHVTRVTCKQNRRPFTDLQPIAKTMDLLGVPWMTPVLSQTHSSSANEGNENFLTAVRTQRQPTARDEISGIVKSECEWQLPSTDFGISTTAVDHHRDDDDDVDPDVDDDYDQMWRPWWNDSRRISLMSRPIIRYYAAIWVSYIIFLTVRHSCLKISRYILLREMKLDLNNTDDMVCFCSFHFLNDSKKNGDACENEIF